MMTIIFFFFLVIYIRNFFLKLKKNFKSYVCKYTFFLHIDT